MSMSPQVSLPRSSEAARLAAALEAAPTLTLRGRQRAAALAELDASRTVEPAPGVTPQAVTVAAAAVVLTLTL